MADTPNIAELKVRLRKAVSDFCTGSPVWKRPVLQTIREIRNEHWSAVLFGGTVRSLFLRATGKSTWPRDIDIVVKDIPLDLLETRFHPYVVRRTRFGGLHLQRSAIPFDIWPLSGTWALIKRNGPSLEFADLPSTTFFNIEAIAVDLWAKPGRTRHIYSGDDQFFTGMVNRIVEINLEDNPFPALCVVRGLLFATGLNFNLGPKFARYVVRHGQGLSVDDLERIQKKHYGVRKSSGEQLQEWIKITVEQVSQSSGETVALPRWTQLSLLNEKDQSCPRLHLASLQLHGTT